MGKLGMLLPMGCQRVGHNLVTEEQIVTVILRAIFVSMSILSLFLDCRGYTKEFSSPSKRGSCSPYYFNSLQIVRFC